jgi:hypothetical protein
VTTPPELPGAKPLCIDLFAGLGGWTEGFLANGYQVVGFDIERHVYGEKKYPAQLVLQDVLTLHGSQFKDAAIIVASPPCQKYSYMAMPWTRAKNLAVWYREDEQRQVELNTLFNACFRIQREACEAAGRHIPLVVENVRGARPWVGSSAWNFGSFHLWGDVPALMPITGKPGRSFQSAAVDGLKVTSESGRRTDVGNGTRFTTRDCGIEGRKGFAARINDSPITRHGSKSSARKAASAEIAKIPLALADWIARIYKPRLEGAV